MASSEGGKQIGHVIQPQDVFAVSRVAVKMSNELFRAWCRSWGEKDDLDRALALLQDTFKMVRISAPAAIEHAVGLLEIRAEYFRERLFRRGKKLDAESAVEVCRRALELDPGNLPAMTILGDVRNTQYHITGHRWMLEEAIDSISQVLAACPFPHANMDDALITAAQCLMLRAEADGCLDDLHAAIELARLGINIGGSAGHVLSIFRRILAQGLALRYEVTENESDMTEAEDLIVEADKVTTLLPNETHRDMVKGRVYCIRFMKLRQKKDILASVRAYANAFRGLSEYSARPSSCVLEIGTQIAQLTRQSYHLSPSSSTLSSAYWVAKSVWTDAVAHSKDWESDFTLIDIHQTIAEIQRSRYQRYLALDILDDCVYHFRQCVKLTSHHNPHFGARAARLSAMLRVKFKSNQVPRFHRIIARQEAAYWIKQILRAVSPFQPVEKRECLQEIADLTQDLRIGSMTVEMLDQAMCHYLTAEKVPTIDFDSNVGIWRRTAQALVDKGQLTNHVKCYESAQEYLDKIEVLSKRRDCRSTGHLPLMARLNYAKYDLEGSLQDAFRAVALFYGIFRHSNYEVGEKIAAVRSYMTLLTRVRTRQDAKSKELFSELEQSPLTSAKSDDAAMYHVELMLQLVTEGIDRNQQLSIIRREGSTPRLCLWYSKSANKSAFEILRVYERGRSILWDRLINSKTQVDALEQKHKDLAERYRNVRQSLTNPFQTKAVNSMIRNDKYYFASELDAVIKEIRGTHGFEDFLVLPLAEEEMRSFARHGPIMYLLTGLNDGPGLALIIDRDSVSMVDLPDFKDSHCQQRYDRLRRVLEFWNEASTEMDHELNEVLKWLWYSAAEPVLKSIGLLRTNRHLEPLPRVWWVTSNWVSRLPMHAAGDHKLATTEKEPCTVMDNAISSYTPTLRALRYSRSRLDHLIKESSAPPSQEQAVLVAMQDTPDWPSLQHANAEVNIVQDILKCSQVHSKLLNSPHVSRKDVVLNLRKCTVAHLACHGEADRRDPLRSKLLLQDWAPKPLRVGFLMRMDMTHCQLAYLSACQTAVNQDEALAEEGLHLSGAFQMAGVPNTIATSWNILDKEAVDVAERFYRGLSNGKSGELDLTRCARSLHATTKEMRDRGSSPYVWGSYAHFGA